MKKILFPFFLLLFTMNVALSQQTPEQIAKMLRSYEQLLKVKDDGFDSVYVQINQQIAASAEQHDHCAIWHSCMAELLNGYYSQNRWRIMGRTHVEGTVPDDPKVWDNETMLQQIVFHYEQSLANAEILSQLPLSDYQPLLDTLANLRERPSLFDFLAYSYLDFLRNEWIRVSATETPFDLNDEVYFSDNHFFVNFQIASGDELSFAYLTLKTMRQLTQLHLNDADPTPLLAVTISRLKYVYAHTQLDNKDSLYLSAVFNLEEQYRHSDGYAKVSFLLGEIYRGQGEKYNADQYPEYKDAYIQAVKWLEISRDVATNEDEKNKALNLLSEIRCPSINLRIHSECHPEVSNLLNIEYRNCEKLYVRVIPVDPDAMRNLHHFEDIYKRFYNVNPVFEQTVTLSRDNDYCFKKGHLLLPSFKAGDYLVMVSDSAFTKNNKGCFAYAEIRSICFSGTYRVSNEGVEVFVFDTKTGMPLEGVEVVVKRNNYYRNGADNESYTLKSDKDGRCLFLLHKKLVNRGSFSVEARWKKQSYAISNYLYVDRKTDDIDENTHYHVHLFTDRTIYRPGQTVYYKGVCVRETPVDKSNLRYLKGYLIRHNFAYDCAVEAAKPVSLTLKDANYQDVAQAEHMTNAYGSFSGSFVLPTSGLTGRYQLQTDAGYCTFQVEEYKRPTFEVVMEQPDAEFKLNQIVVVDGNVKAFAGYGLDGATVKYQVKRSASFPWWRCWWWWPSSNDQEIAHGELKTDGEGRFHIDFPASPDLQAQRYNPLYMFEITVVVTDITGETHTAQSQIYISKTGLVIESDLPEMLEMNDQRGFVLNVNNLAGKPQRHAVHFEVAELELPTDYRIECPGHDYYLSDSAAMHKALPFLAFNGEHRMENWKVLKIVSNGDFEADGQRRFSIPNLNQLKEGVYKVHFSTVDKDGNTVENVSFVTVYQKYSKKCAAYRPIRVIADPSANVKAGDEIYFVVGSYLKHANVLCQIYCNANLVESQWITLDRGQTKISYKVGTKDYGRIRCCCFVAQNGSQYQDFADVMVYEEGKDLRFEFLSFRDKTEPGAKEQFQVRIRDSKGDKVASELLCSMYDASLDAFARTNSFQKSIFPVSFYEAPVLMISHSFSFPKNYGSLLGKIPHYEVPSPINSNWNVALSSRKNHVMYRANGADRGYLAKSANAFEDIVEEEENVSYNLAQPEVAQVDAAFFVFEDVAAEDSDPASAENPLGAQPESQLQVRKNFNETAFFYPHLHTDENGDVLISFTMPESLTKWKMMGFAHTAYLQSGYFEKFVQTSKKLMVVPNAPRFLREGDTLLFTVKVVNMDTVTQCGNVVLDFRNALDNKLINIVEGTNAQSFEMKPNESQEVRFKVVVPRDLSAVTYRVVASNLESPMFADGEEATLPVLSDRILITESLPLHISGKGSKSFTLSKLKNSFDVQNPTLTTQSLTLEFTPNPIWNAIQALPYLMEYPYDCNEQIFSKYYANALAANLMKNHPKIQEVFKHWLNDTPESFCAKLEKNQELKSVLLEETPWVMNAQNEAERKQNLALLFNLQRMADEGSAACQKLEERQNHDGGWSWFAKHESSPYITTHILAGWGHLRALGVPTQFSEKTRREALNYIDRQMNEYYQKWDKKTKDLSAGNIHYLYARSFHLDQKVAKHCQEAYDFYYANLKKNWKEYSVYMQGMAALVCYRNGDVQQAKQIVAHIKSLAQYSEEMGMFWKKNGYGYFWYEAPIERQALLIEAFHTIAQDSQSVEKMQCWLLKQKQTQSWPTTKSTTEAVYALLLNNNNLDQNGGVKVTVGDWSYTEGDTTVAAEAGSGYCKQSWPGQQVTAEMATVQISKQNAGPAWGGLYWQYLEQLDKVDHSQDGGCSIQKQLFKVSIGDRGEQLTPISESSPIKVGDKVCVRVEIRTDRDMEYVHLKDMRAACFEPTNVLSGYKHQDGLWYYESTRDAATNFFIDYLPKGTYVFEYTMVATMPGDYSNGLTTIQCLYAPEFTSHSEGIRVKVK